MRVELNHVKGSTVFHRADNRYWYCVIPSEGNQQNALGDQLQSVLISILEALEGIHMDHIDVTAIHDPDTLQEIFVKLVVIISHILKGVDSRRITDAPRSISGSRFYL